MKHNYFLWNYVQIYCVYPQIKAGLCREHWDSVSFLPIIIAYFPNIKYWEPGWKMEMSEMSSAWLRSLNWECGFIAQERQLKYSCDVQGRNRYHLVWNFSCTFYSKKPLWTSRIRLVPWLKWKSLITNPVSHHVVAANWTQDLQKNRQCS